MARNAHFPLARWRSAVIYAFLTLTAAGHAAIDLDGGVSTAAATGGSSKVPCSQLPELKHLALQVAILGDCT